MFDICLSFPTAKHEDFPVLLVFDEVIALWPESSTPLIGKNPWNMAAFDTPQLQYGALLVSGTTDCEFISQIPSGANEILVSVGPLDTNEQDALMRTEGFKPPLHDLKDVDEELWQNIVDSSGNIRRELKKFCAHLGKDARAGKRKRSSDDIADEDPPLGRNCVY
jgi:hypothetical protein